MRQLEDSYVDKNGATHQYYQPVDQFLLTSQQSNLRQNSAKDLKDPISAKNAKK